MSITIQITPSVLPIREQWNALLPAKHHLAADHLAALERSDLPDIQYWYLQVFESGAPVGVVYLQLFNFQHKHLNFSNIKSGWAKLIQVLLPKKLPLLVCGHLFRIDFQGFYFVNPAKQQLLFNAIDLFSKQSLIKPCGIMIKDCHAPFGNKACGLSGYHFFNGDVTMELARRNHWNSFDDYIADLKKDYAKRAKKMLRSMDGIVTRQLDAAEILNQSADIEALYWNVVNKQTVKLGTVNARYLYELKQDLGAAFELHGLYENDRMVGFYTFIFYQQHMETHYIGLDYEANRRYKLYFNILFAGIRELAQRRLNFLELGRTARDAKANLGAVPKQIVNYIRVANPLIRAVLNYVLTKFNQSEQASSTQRNPLK